MRRIGVHTSIAGGVHLSLERAHALGCTTLQIFSHNPRGWAVRGRDKAEIARFKRIRKKLDLSPVFIHSSYLINLASSDPALQRRSVQMTAHELENADELGAEFVVVHTGSASAEQPDIARGRAIESLREVSRRGDWKARLLLENTAGERGDITSSIEAIAEIMANVPGAPIGGICFDTCHAFAAGYDVAAEKGISSLSRKIETLIGRNSVRLIHLNDSKGGLGSRLDRHEHIGEGKIGLAGMRRILRNHFFREIPLVLETPKKEDDDDRRNLALVRELQP